MAVPTPDNPTGVPVPASSIPLPEKAAEPEKEEEVPSFVAGSRLEVGWPVKRGPDWDYGEQDGGGQSGEVYFVKGGWCIIQWKEKENEEKDEENIENLAANLYAYPWQDRVIEVVGDPNTFVPLPGGPAVVEKLLTNIAKNRCNRTKIRVDIQRIGNLNTVEQNYRCGFVVLHEREMDPLELKWWLTYISHKDYSPDALLSGNAINFLKEKLPKLQIKNTLEVHNEDRREMERMPQIRVTNWPGIDSNSPNCFRIRTSKWYDRTIFSELDLRNFPLDCNELVLEFKAMKPKNVETYEPHDGAHAFVHLSTQQSLGTCEIERVLVEVFDRKQQTGSSYKDRLKKAHEKALKEYSCIAIRIKIARSWKIYLWRIGFFLAIIGLMGVTVTYMLAAYGDSGLRVEVQGNLLTLLLAAVAFQVTFEAELPETQYMTFLDQYVNWSFFYLALISIEVSIADAIEDHVNDMYPSRLTWAIIMVIIYFAGQLFFAIKGYLVRQKERLKLEADEGEIEDGRTQKPFDIKLKKGQWDTQKYRSHKWIAKDTDQLLDNLDEEEERVQFLPELRPKKNAALAALKRRKSDGIDNTPIKQSNVAMENLKKTIAPKDENNKSVV